MLHTMPAEEKRQLKQPLAEQRWFSLEVYQYDDFGFLKKMFSFGGVGLLEIVVFFEVLVFGGRGCFMLSMQD